MRLRALLVVVALGVAVICCGRSDLLDSYEPDGESPDSGHEGSSSSGSSGGITGSSGGSGSSGSGGGSTSSSSSGSSSGGSASSSSSGCTTGLVKLASGLDLPLRMAIDSSSAYYADEHAVRKVPLCGGPPQTLATGTPWAVAVDATRVYWTDVSGTIMSAPKNGGPSATLASGQCNPDDLVVNATDVFWSFDCTAPDYSGISEVPRGGGKTVPRIENPPGSVGLAIDPSNLYFGYSARKGTPGGVSGLPLPQGTVFSVSTDASPSEITVDATDVYYSTGPFDGVSVVKTPLHGGATTTLATGQTILGGVAVDDVNVYFSTVTGGTLVRVPKAGGAAVTLESGQRSPHTVVVDATSVYWVVEGAGTAGGAVMKLTPK